MMTIDYPDRAQRFRQQNQTDVFALIPGTNMFYFTGLDFHLGKRPLLAFFSAQGITFVIPLLEENKVREVLPDATLYTWSDTEGYEQALSAALVALGLNQTTRLGVDGFTMRVFEYLALQQAGLAAERMHDVGRELMMFRALKTSEEAAAIRAAIAISEQALSNLMAWVKPGMSERAIAERLNDEQRQLGADELAFETIVLVGARSALPHGNPGDGLLQDNDILLIDYGCKINHYPSDITRTFLIGTPTPQMIAIYDAVRDANAAARAVAGPGVTWGAVDKAARDVIEQAGFGEYFTHRTGHGLGLDGHELPQIASGESDTLQPGMVFTIEPGIYVPGVGGVRIEDNLLVTDNGAECLTSYSRERHS